MRIAVLAFLLVSRFASHAIAADAAIPGDAKLELTYVVRDAPVWTADGKFDPAVLVKLIEASVDFGEAASASSLRIQPLPQAGALSVRTTVAAHKKIRKLLMQFPAVAKTLGAGDPDYAKLLKGEVQRVKHTMELNQRLERSERDRFRALRKKSSIDAIFDPTEFDP